MFGRGAAHESSTKFQHLQMVSSIFEPNHCDLSNVMLSISIPPFHLKHTEFQMDPGAIDARLWLHRVPRDESGAEQGTMGSTRGHLGSSQGAKAIQATHGSPTRDLECQ